MKILVIDVAAEHGGALSILKQFVDKFRSDTQNEYVVCVGNVEFQDGDNIKFVKIPWVKHSRIRRLYFDSIYINKLIKEHRPDRIFSLQNKAFKTKGIPQDVYFHNALFICEKRFSFRESKKLWVYQNIISRLTRTSLRFASRIFVQADWIKQALAKKWNISREKIFVERTSINPIFFSQPLDNKANNSNVFYPANFSKYKNHATLLKACIQLWDEEGREAFSLLLTGDKQNAPHYLTDAADKYPIYFLGRLNVESMVDAYRKSILVFPSYIETAALPLLEAKALSRPIIAADCEYAHESIGEYSQSAYFPPFDSNALYAQLKEFIRM